MSEVDNEPVPAVRKVPEGALGLSPDLLIRLAQRSRIIRGMLDIPIPPCPPEFARLMSRFVSWDFRGETLHVHLDDTGSLSLSEKLRCVKRDFYYLAQVLLGSPDVKQVVGTSWIIGKNPGLIQKLGFTALGDIDAAEKAADFPNEERGVGRATIGRDEFIRRYYGETKPGAWRE